MRNAWMETAIISFCVGLLALLMFTVVLVFTASDSTPLDGHCYGVMDSRGQVHQSDVPPQTSPFGLVTKVIGERVTYVTDPVHVIADTECICETGIEDLPEEECNPNAIP